jgi:hypothetical protein
LNFNLVPEWDGHGKTVIAYLCKISELVRLSPQMVADLGTIAPLKFTDRAEMWWTTQSVTVRNYVSQSWSLLFKAIETHFLNDQWLQDRMSEFEEMKFRQRGHEEEMPMDFLQRRSRYNAFLYPDQEDGTAVVDRLLRTAPTVWLGDINSERYPNLFSLFAATRRHCATLMASWNTAVQLRTLGNYYSRRSNPRHAHAVDHDQSDKTADEVDPASEVEERDANAGFRGPRRPRTEGNNRANPSSSKMRWPEGKTVKGYAFSKRDEVHSE